MTRLKVALDVIRRAGASSVEAALSAFDPTPPPPTGPPVDTAALPFTSSAEAGLAVSG